ncbi:3-demethylubiquinone-9 3-methyltransferase [compost metagenome]
MQKIGPCLWFNGQAEAAVAFYTSTFKNSRTLETTYYVDDMHMPAGTVMTIRFVLDGAEFMALNGGPEFVFSPAISFVVHCADQQEVDDLWQKLLVNGREDQCGWLTDQFGLSWQIVPEALITMLKGGDTAAAQRTVAAMLKMKKLNIAELERAYKGGGTVSGIF